MKGKLFLAGFSAVLIAGGFLPAFANSPAVFESLTTVNSSINANNQDVQTATLILNTAEPASIDRVSFLVNYKDNSGNPDRGYMSWYKTTGFKKEGGYGSEHINLKISDCSVDTSVPNKFIVTFKWTCLPTYGERANNDIAYYVVQYGSPIFGGWQNADTNFNVHSVTAQLASLIVNETPVLANNSDAQTAVMTLNAPEPDSVDRVSFLINYKDDSGNPDRGYISWYKATGFKKEGGYGSEYINLLIDQCSVIKQNGQFIITFKWTCLPTYGEIANNDIAYYIVQYGSVLNGGWQNHNTNFTVQSVTAHLASLTVNETPVLANNSDAQTAVMTLDEPEPGSIDRVSFLINYKDDSGNPDRGYISWYKATGFKKEGGYGSEYINLLTDQCRVQEQNGQFIITFKWTCLPTYGEMANNDIAYYIVQYGSVLNGGWQNYNTNFTVHSVTAHLASLTVNENPVLANNSDAQTAVMTLDAPEQGSVDRVSFLINYKDDSGNPDRGYISWYKATGFKKEGGYGSEYINLLLDQCSVDTSQTGKFIITFKWTCLPTYGGIANNDIAYYLVQYGSVLNGGWQNHDTNFTVQSVTAQLASLTVDKATIMANNTDVQTAVMTLNAPEPGSVDRVSFLINYKDDSGNPDRGYISWYKTTGFKKEGGYGSQYINLLLSQCSVDTSQAGKFIVTFKWTCLPAYGEMPNNDIAYYVVQYGTVLYNGWQNYDTNFNVSLNVAVLGVTVSPENWDIGILDAHSVRSMSSGEGITVTNTGTANTTYSLMVHNPANWIISQVSPGPEQYVLNAAFASAADTIQWNEANHALSVLAVKATAVKFAADQNGFNVPPAGIRKLWLQFKAPSETAVKTEQSIEIIVTAETP